MNWYEEIAVLLKNNKKLALCTIVNSKGSVPRHVGAKMIVYGNGEIKGTIGGGNLEKKVIENALIQINENKPKLYTHDLLHQHNMCCGGTVQIFIEPIMPKNKLYIFGAGHTSKELCQLAVKNDFEVFVFDDREDYIKDLQVEGVNKLFVDFNKIIPTLPFDSNTYACVLTYEHSIDREILFQLVQKPHAYIGMIGSKRKVEITKKKFIASGLIKKKDLEKIDMPIGVNIQTETPYEIAISIMAKIIDVKNKRKNK
ncbi:MAG: XdhC/CoxI family protein [Vicingaceae bacterium]